MGARLPPTDNRSWGHGTQVKWRAELRERELERMSGLEGEWRRREAARTAEVAKSKAHYAHLETQTRQVRFTSQVGWRHSPVAGMLERLSRGGSQG